MGEATCDCISCDAAGPHSNGRCGRKVGWYVEIHPVDYCKTVEGGLVKAVLCQQCFDAHVQRALAIIKWGLQDGVRSPWCGGCHYPMIRLSAIIRDVAKI